MSADMIAENAELRKLNAELTAETLLLREVAAQADNLVKQIGGPPPDEASATPFGLVVLRLAQAIAKARTT